MIRPDSTYTKDLASQQHRRYIRYNGNYRMYNGSKERVKERERVTKAFPEEKMCNLQNVCDNTGTGTVVSL